MLLQKGRIWEFYSAIKKVMDSPDPLGRMVQELISRVRWCGTSQLLPLHLLQLPPWLRFRGKPSLSGICELGGTVSGWMSKSRQTIAEVGLYNKHSLDHLLLKGFATYLGKDQGVENYKQEIDNVACNLFFMDPAEPNLNFARDLGLRFARAAHSDRPDCLPASRGLLRACVRPSSQPRAPFAEARWVHLLSVSTGER
ncbi:hypothetical protein JZ751_024994 [Albula glossodonta]|uniref:Uncharacterized protein n=1 Tax=Albula glossodonta TaxID=121402 RepID=A0A8T2PF03_9TELE|nr:hypothetical protein JZ751_024994 [Albula glossodonta]